MQRPELIRVGPTSEAPPPLRWKWLSKVEASFADRSGQIPGNLLIILILTALLFVGALTFFWVQYQTNDDVAMNLYASGKALGQPPSEFLLFQHFVIGLLLEFLYTHFPTLPWYGMLMYAYLFLSCLGGSYAVSRLRPSPGFAGLSVVPLILFYLPVIVSPQFTICAGYLAISGVLLLYSVICQPSPSIRGNFWMISVASVLLVVAGLIRFYSLLLVLLLMAPVYLYLLVTRIRATLRYLLPVLGGVLCLSGLLNWGQQIYYRHSPGWDKFYSYNNVRADFMDRHRIVWNEMTAPLFKQIGWSQNDLAMLTSWFYLDPEIYSFQKLAFVSQHASVLPGPRILWSRIFTDLKTCFFSYAGLATLFLCGWLLVKGKGILRAFAVLALLWCSILFVGINVAERHLPLRVWLVIILGLYGSQVALWSQVGEENRWRVSGAIVRFGRIAFLVLGAAFCTACCWGQIGSVIYLSRVGEIRRARFQTDLARLQPRQTQLFVTWGGSFPYEEFQLPTHARPISENMQLLGLGVGNHEPFVQTRLQSFKISDLYQSFYTREDIFLICEDFQKPLLIQYIEEHYQTKVEIVTVFKGMTFTVSKVRKVS